MSCKRKKLQSLATCQEWVSSRDEGAGWHLPASAYRLWLPCSQCPAPFSQGITNPGLQGCPWGRAGPAPAFLLLICPVQGVKVSRAGGEWCWEETATNPLFPFCPSGLCCHRADKSGAIWGLFCTVQPSFLLLKFILLSTWIPWQNRDSYFLVKIQIHCSTATTSTACACSVLQLLQQLTAVTSGSLYQSETVQTRSETANCLGCKQNPFQFFPNPDF